MTGRVAYREDSRRATFVAAKGDYDECQIDKSGRWLVIKENVDGRDGEDNRIIDLQSGAEQVFLDRDGAAGHSDLGYGYLVAEDNMYSTTRCRAGVAARPGPSRRRTGNRRLQPDRLGCLLQASVTSRTKTRKRACRSLSRWPVPAARSVRIFRV